MPPFRYESAIDPRVAGSLADLMLRRGDIRAQQAVAVANANARATELGGLAWAGAARDIGQSAAGAIQYATDPRRKLDAVQLEQAQAHAKDANALRAGERQVDSLMAGDQLPAGETGPRQESYLTADGLFDVPKLHQALASSGRGHLAPELLKGAEAINTSILQHQQDEQRLGASSALLFGDMAKGALDLSQVGMPIPAAMDFVIRPALATKRTTPVQYAQIRDHIASLPPEQQTAALTTFMDAAAKLDKGENLAEGTAHVDRYGRTVATGGKKPQRPVVVGTGSIAVNPETGATVATGPAKEPAAKAYQHVDKLLDGKPATLLLDPAPGGKLYDLSGKEVENAAVRVKPIPPASVTIHNQNAAAAQGEISGTAKGIAEYRIPAPSARSMASGEGKALMEQVLRANPDYDASQFPTRSKMRIQFSSGPQSQTINSINTAIGHLDQFVDVAKALDNGNFRPGNQAFNWLKATFGDSAPTNFEGIRSIMSGELASAFKKSGATDQEIKSVEQAIASKNSTGQLVDYATQIAIPALGSKIAAFDQQYKQVMGAKDPFKVLTPDAEEVLIKYGFDPAHPRMGASTPHLQPNASHVVEQGGVRYRVTTDASGKVVKSEVVQ